MEFNFSLIIPVFNTELYIEKCLKSIQNQTYNSYEVVIVDDGSEDNSIFICEQYQKRINNLTILKQENKGLSYARNKALKICKGKYIWFIDSDDFIKECDALENIYSELEKDSLDILQFNAQFKVTSMNKWSLEKNKKLLINKIKSTDVLNGKDFLNLIASNNEWRYGVWMFIFSREFLLKNKLDFDENYIHEDAAFNVKALIVCNRMRFSDKCYYTYRVRPNSIMSVPTTIANISGYIQAYKSIEKTFVKNGYVSNFYLRSIYLQLVERVFYLKDSSKLEKYIEELEKLGQLYSKNFNSTNLIIEAKTTSEKCYNNFLEIHEIHT